jgi:hypothetical protein
METGLVRLLFRTSFVEPHQSLTFSLELRKFSFNVSITLPLALCGMKLYLTC